MNLGLIRTGISQGLTPALGLNIYEHISGAQSLPFGVLGNVEGIEYSKDFSGKATVSIPLWVVVDRADDVSAQQALDRAVSIGNAESVYTAVRSLADIDGKPWRSLKVLGTSPYGTFNFGATKCLAVSFDLQISA